MRMKNENFEIEDHGKPMSMLVDKWWPAGVVYILAGCYTLVMRRTSFVKDCVQRSGRKFRCGLR